MRFLCRSFWSRRRSSRELIHERCQSIDASLSTLPRNGWIFRKTKENSPSFFTLRRSPHSETPRRIRGDNSANKQVPDILRSIKMVKRLSLLWRIELQRRRFPYRSGGAWPLIYRENERERTTFNDWRCLRLRGWRTPSVENSAASRLQCRRSNSGPERREQSSSR
jgi:hypothetical protein